ncbi:SEC-C metal-binding domain-containing protein [Geotalea sp. SG265]|uniref:SEC-C metal-binding domain-containing protein n=1 Tax=Geotalea sp. SG265 TaxID=2922867 RepID=UPI001FAFAFE2|nr:SEC-C metal-binding domain-containing protein [Geotalea sp. SG265]
MGKKARIKHRSVTKAKNKGVKPDEVFQYGPLEMVRFGELIVGRSSLNEKQFEAMQDKFAAKFPEVCLEIDKKIDEITAIVKTIPLPEYFHRACWEKAGSHLNKKAEVDIDHDAVVSQRMIDYIQSVAVSTLPAVEKDKELDEGKWNTLKSLVHDLFMQLNTEFMLCQTAVNRKTVDFDENIDEFYAKAQMMWCNVRGKRYLYHDIPFYRDVLSPHEDILRASYGIVVEGVLEALKAIQTSLTFGIPDVTEELFDFQQQTYVKLQERLNGKLPPKDEMAELMLEVIKENGWEQWRDDIFGRFSRLDLFDLGKITTLPQPLLEDLSYEPGQETSFFADGQYKGWPLRIWPVFKRPFIKLDGHYYCFDIYSLFDNLYRIVQRAVIARYPDYSPMWNQKQQMLSESIPLQLFAKLLPGAQFHHPVYYRWETAPGGKKQWCEADALIIFEGHLFVIEVKAGAFTYTPPTTDFPAYLESIKNLVYKPAEQGKRFLEYFRSADEVSLFDCDHKEIGRLSHNDFENVTVCAITLDPFTEIAGQIQHLKKIGIDVGTHPVWSVSIDDLRVYSEIFDNPLVFLHFVEQRMRAFASALIETDDELDHLGLYIKHNVYSQYVEDFKSMDKITWYGYRSKIDGYFANKLLDSDTKCLIRQELPPRLEELVYYLAKQYVPGCQKVASMILNSGQDLRDSIALNIDETLALQSKSKKAKALSSYGSANITMFCWQQGVIERNQTSAREHTMATMLVTNDPERLLLELSFDTAGNLSGVDFEVFKLQDISLKDQERLKADAEKLKVKRIENFKKISGKIGRNQPCPCGSGLKYKKCCLSP